MIRNVYIPSDYNPRPNLYDLTAEEKLRIVENSPVIAKKTGDVTKISLPFGISGDVCVMPGIESYPGLLIIHRLVVGNSDLYGKGIGSRMVRAATRYGLEEDPHLKAIYAKWPRWGFLNTVVKVFGIESVSAHLDITQYGRGGSKPLEAILDDKPIEPYQPYILDGLDAVIDRTMVESWELPVTGPARNEFY